MFQIESTHQSSFTTPVNHLFVSEDDPHLAVTFISVDCEAGCVCVLSPGVVHVAATLA